MGGACGMTGGMRTMYDILVKKPEGKTVLGHRHGYEGHVV